ncbi:hypothetical protein Sj15T_02920 [Sphingobium sp. TA15]|uniref:DUF3606 domain-containing protein n=4 Tax=Sphingobium indicum TaxID=332055 RepID=D4Z026_SPHIU|nr:MULTISPECIES: DUF3606 domain-containing protein [Sphingobium]EPR17335.1 hypothetical protein M527_16850 [Sphingobium indicum IP26]KEY97690.1 hypothetical protein AI27_17120 [Sphingomonas sp. BHC-A]BDD65271.1 hypothetical protein Sj15T_02920 [Sphingobium sp. TA15]APL94558.1 hypothetical protein SIDU_08620 [Sphingobium indicum B90A]EQA99673.1 hypothetical protein L286_19250 [Sphingobium sp. HDIP04]
MTDVRTLSAPAAPADLKHVSLDREGDARYWQQRFGTSRARLEQAVERVGHHVNAIAEFLHRRR